MIAFFFWSFLSPLADTPQGSTELRKMILVDIVIYSIFFISCFLISYENGSKYGIPIKCIGIVGSWALNLYRDGLNQDEKYGLLAMLNYDMFFIASGIIDG